jgi:hypothetical protein
MHRRGLPLRPAAPESPHASRADFGYSSGKRHEWHER